MSQDNHTNSFTGLLKSKKPMENNQQGQNNSNEKQNQGKENSENKSMFGMEEKWLYGLAGFGLGSLTTYLIMDYQQKNKEKSMNGTDKQQEETQNKKSKRKAFL